MRTSRATRRQIRRLSPHRRIRHLRLSAALAAALVALAGCGGSGNQRPPAPSVQRVARATLAPNGDGLSRPLPPKWVITLRAWFPVKRSKLRLELGSTAVTVFDGSHIWHRVEVTTRGVVVDGHRTGAAPLAAPEVTMRAIHAAVDIRNLVIRRSPS